MRRTVLTSRVLPFMGYIGTWAGQGLVIRHFGLEQQKDILVLENDVIFQNSGRG